LTCLGSVHDFVHGIAYGKACGLGTWWELLEATQPLRNKSLGRNEHEGSMRVPIGVVYACRSALERIGAQIVDIRRPQLRKFTLPNPKWRVRTDLGVLLHERDLPLEDTNGHQITIVAPVKELLAR